MTHSNTSNPNYVDFDVQLAVERAMARFREAGPVVAEHDEEEDIEIVKEAMGLVRELIAREAMDGPTESVWKLYRLVCILDALASALWEEEWDVLRKEYEETLSDASVRYAEYASRQAEVTAGADEEEVTEGDDMALSEEDKNEIAGAVASALEGPLNSIAQALAGLASREAPVAEAAEEVVDETEEATEAVAEVEVTEEAEPVEAPAEAAEEVEEPAVATEETVETVAESESEVAEAANTDEEEEDDDEEDEEEPMSDAAEAAEEELENLIGSVTGGGPSAAGLSAGSSMRTYSLRRGSGREDYLNQVRAANGLQPGEDGSGRLKAAAAATTQKRIPVGVVSTQGGAPASAGRTKEQIKADLTNLFRR